jgi:cardiolipin synthase
MKSIKIFFIRYIIVAIAILIELAFIILSLSYWRDIFQWLKILTTVLSVLVFFHLINKNVFPEAKIPWLTTIMLFPLLGTILYICFSNNKPSKKQIKIINHDQQIIDGYYKKDKKLTFENVENKNYGGIFRYLNTTTHLNYYNNSKTTFFDSGSKFLNSLLQDLKNAKKFIFLEYFIIDYGEMWDKIYEILKQKVNEGVEVRVIYDDIGTLGKLRGNFCNTLRKDGINCQKFNIFVPIISGMHNNRDHRKITIIDGNIGYTGGINLADEYINKKELYGHWKDSALKIEGEGVKNFTMLFLQLFDVCQKSVSDYDKYLNVDFKKYNTDEIVLPFGTGPTPYNKEQIATNNFINMISSANKSVYITTPYLIIDYNLTSAIKNASLRGVDVRIIVPHIPDKKIIFGMTRSSYKNLQEAGVKIYEYTPGFIHSKQVLIDGELAFIGTINFDYRSLIHHYECGVVVLGNNTAKNISADFENLFKSSEEKTLENFKISKLNRLLNTIFSIFRPLF